MRDLKGVAGSAKVVGSRSEDGSQKIPLAHTPGPDLITNRQFEGAI